MHVSTGGELVYDSRQPVGERVVSHTVLGAALTYRLIPHAFSSGTVKRMQCFAGHKKSQSFTFGDRRLA